MKKIRIGFALITGIFSLLLISCKHEVVTYTDMLKEEQVVIDNFIDKQGFKVLKEYPTDGVFGEKEFVLLENGVYLHVIDSGNGNRPVKGTGIESLAKGFVLGDTENRYNFDGFASTADKRTWPLTFTYDETTPYDWNDYLGDGYINVMDYVGNNSEVSMIIPFSVGSLFQNQNYCAMYFEKVSFTFVKE